jgi:hypothetical protein
MSYTVQQVINDALVTIGVLFPFQTPSSSMSNDALNRLNEMLYSWTLERTIVYSISANTYALTSGTNAYTIGSGGSLDGTRPNSIVRANIVTPSLGLRSPLKLATTEEWSMVIDQAATSTTPELLYDDYEYPLSNILLWPAPNSSSTMLELFTWQPLDQFAALSDTFDMPPGYQLAVTYNLAQILAPVYGRQMPPDAAQIAMDSLNKIRGINMPPTHVSGAGEEAQATATVAQMAAQTPPNQLVGPVRR